MDPRRAMLIPEVPLGTASHDEVLPGLKAGNVGLLLGPAGSPAPSLVAQEIIAGVRAGHPLFNGAWRVMEGAGSVLLEGVPMAFWDDQWDRFLSLFGILDTGGGGVNFKELPDLVRNLSGSYRLIVLDLEGWPAESGNPGIGLVERFLSALDQIANQSGAAILVCTTGALNPGMKYVSWAAEITEVSEEETELSGVVTGAGACMRLQVVQAQGGRLPEPILLQWKGGTLAPAESDECWEAAL